MVLITILSKAYITAYIACNISYLSFLKIHCINSLATAVIQTEITHTHTHTQTHTHTLIGKLVYVFLSKINLSIDSLVKKSLRKYYIQFIISLCVIRNFNIDEDQCSSREQYFSHQSSIAKTPFTHSIFLRRSLFSLHVELTSSLSYVLQESVPSVIHTVTYLLIALRSLQSHLNHQTEYYKYLKIYYLKVQHFIHFDNHFLLVAIYINFPTVIGDCHSPVQNLRHTLHAGLAAIMK